VMAPTQATEGELEAKQLGMGLLALAGANIVGSILLGKHAIWPAAGALAIGIMKKNLYWTMAGAGLLLANGYQETAPPPISGTDEEMEGFDLASFTDKAKARARNYFSSFAEKLYLPRPATAAAETPAVNGMNGGEEEVNYFLNPYSQVGAVDTSDLDKLQAKIDSMNADASQRDVVGEIDLSERNF
jgi:hypothetical protein